MNLLQDILGLVTRKQQVKPVDTDVLPIGRYKTSKEVFKPKPEMKTNLVTLRDLKNYISKDPSGDNQTLSLDGNDLSISNGNTVDLSTLDLDSSSVPVKLVPFNIVAGADQSGSLPLDYNLINLSWDGLGNGIYRLNIPSASLMLHRNIRIVTDGTLDNGAQDKINVTAASGETIDGASFFEISKRYEGISIWSDGVEWRIIQAKAH
jgi:hypothetical protein